MLFHFIITIIVIDIILCSAAETATSGAAALGMAWTVVISALLFV